MNYLKRFLHEDEGQDMVEYGLLAAFIAVVAFAAVQAVGDQVKIVFENIAKKLGA
jgi:pilus assembly protein Flp/PilA